MIQITQLLKLKFAGWPVKTLLFSRIYIFGLGNFLSGCDKIEPIWSNDGHIVSELQQLENSILNELPIL